MLPSLIGIIASSGGVAAGGSYESIATVTSSGSGGSTDLSFTSIPSTYQHLQIAVISIVTTADTGGSYGIRVINNGDFNSDSGSSLHAIMV